MTRKTNRKILKYSLVPICVFIVFALAFPEIPKGTDNPTIVHRVASVLWFFGILGVFIFWAWGVVANFASLIIIPLETKAQKGRLKPNSYEERSLSSLQIFKILNIYVEDEKLK